MRSAGSGGHRRDRRRRRRSRHPRDRRRRKDSACRPVGSAGRTSAPCRTALSFRSSFFRNLAARRSKPAPPVPSRIDSANALSMPSQWSANAASIAMSTGSRLINSIRQPSPAPRSAVLMDDTVRSVMRCFLTALIFFMPLAMSVGPPLYCGPVTGPRFNRVDRKSGVFHGAPALMGAFQLILRIERDRLRKSASLTSSGAGLDVVRFQCQYQRAQRLLRPLDGTDDRVETSGVADAGEGSARSGNAGQRAPSPVPSSMRQYPPPAVLCRAGEIGSIGTMTGGGLHLLRFGRRPAEPHRTRRGVQMVISRLAVARGWILPLRQTTLSSCCRSLGTSTNATDWALIRGSRARVEEFAEMRSGAVMGGSRSLLGGPAVA